MNTLPEDLIGIEDANKALDEMIAADNAAAGGKASDDAAKGDEPGEGQEADDSAAGNAADAAKPGKDSQTDDGKAKEDKARDEQGKFAKAKADENAEAGKPAEAKGTGSRFEKAKARLEGGWQELNTSKAQLQAEREAWTKQREAEKAAIEQERAELEQQRAQAEGQYTPEQYEAAAARFEKEGKFDLADLAKQKAEALRKNPPVKPADRLAGQRKEWALKAGKEFPDIMKDNSPLQVRVAQILKEEPDLERHPKGIYLAARLATLEAQASSSQELQTKLTEKDKALETANKRIAELEQLTAPGDGGNNNRLPGRKSFEQMSESEQFAALEREAQELGVLTR